MGKFLNPGSSGFERMIKAGYVDKTGLIREVNRRIGTSENLICISRPRRFGKSFAAQMLCAYYDCTCASDDIFKDYEIAEDPDYKIFMNQYQVICIDAGGVLSEIKRAGRSARVMTEILLHDIRADLIEMDSSLNQITDASDCLRTYVEKTGRKFVFIIDEWDALIREAAGDRQAQESYLNLLRLWFKNINFTPRVVAAAYMTGILPIKKDGSQSAISDFIEYPVLYPDGFARYTGFTEDEVKRLCNIYKLDFEEIRSWYDGYYLPECGAIYNPYSVMRAVQNKKCRSYWQKTSAAESLILYINMDFDGLQEVAARLIAGEAIEVDVNTFENDFQTFRSKDDVLTLLIHLGYLTYNEDEKQVRIPNEEVRLEFKQILGVRTGNSRWIVLLNKSRKLLEDTLDGNEEAVSQAVSEIRKTQYAPAFYNNEQALRYIIKFAYIAAIDQYMKVEELPSGHGIADVVFIPNRMSMMPILLIELKWNKTAGGAIGQIKNKDYPAVFRDYGGEIVLVGINYDEKNKKHSCVIEKLHI